MKTAISACLLVLDEVPEPVADRYPQLVPRRQHAAQPDPSAVGQFDQLAGQGAALGDDAHSADAAV